MEKIENIFDQALAEIQAGRSLPEILAMHPAHKNELEKMFSSLMPLFNLPKKSIPEPSRQRKYLLAPQPKVWLATSLRERPWLAWLHLSKFAGISISALLLVSTVAAGAYATITALPGSTLFGLKKGTEQLQLTLAMSDQAKADLQIQIAQKRLTEAQLVFSQKTDPEKEKAALNELLEQTKYAIEVTNQLATQHPEPAKNQTAVNTLEQITKQQKTLLTEIKPESQVADNAKQALAQAEENIKDVEGIKQYIATASKEENLVDLDIIRVTGSISTISKGAVTVGSTDLLVTSGTKIMSGSSPIKFADLKEKTPVDVQAKKGADGQLVALEIDVKVKNSSGIVKGTNTEASSTETTQATSSKKTLENPNANKPEDTADTASDPNTAIGSVIFEDPSPTLR